MSAKTATRTSRRWATQAEVAEYLGITPLTVRRMVARGELTAYRCGPRLLRFDLNEVDAALSPVPTLGGDAA